MVRWAWGAVEVTRVDDPGFELILPQDEQTTQALAATRWLHPEWVTAEQALRIGSSATLIRTPSAVVLVDPWLAFDDPARLAPRLSALRKAGVQPDDVDVVVNSHIDGVGANIGVDGEPIFAKARYLFPVEELDDLHAGTHPDQRSGAHPEIDSLLALANKGRLEPMSGHEQVVPGVHLEVAPGHTRGHMVVWVGSGGQEAVVVGHLFLHPAQIADPETTTGDLDPAALTATRRKLLARCVDDDVLLIGPLFAAPGGGRVRPDGTTWRLEPTEG
jgi:glyoxylase-like metal-dependent hydrolase (beta-lactamase superfamily II)